MRVVIKVGTSTLTHQNGNINIRRIENLCKVVSDLKNAGLEIIFVFIWNLFLVYRRLVTGRSNDFHESAAVRNETISFFHAIWCGR